MSLYYMSGWGYNLLSRGTVTASPGSDALYPLTNLYAADSTQRWKASSLAANEYINLDLSTIVTNPGFETSTLSGWTELVTGTGATSESAAGGVGGSKALICNAGASGTAARYQDITVRAGERFKLDAWINPGAGRTGSIRIQNLSTAKYLVSGSWQVAAGAAASVTNETSFTEATSTFQVEALSVCLRDTVTLRLTCYSDEDAAVLFDNVELWPAVNFVSLHGHSLHPAVTVTLRSSTDAFVGVDTAEATVTLALPTCYAYLSTPVYRPDWRIYIGGTNAEIPWIGEAVIGYAETIGHPQRYGWMDTRRLKAVTQEMWSGRTRRYRLSDLDRGSIRMSWSFVNADALTDFEEWKRGLFLRSGADIPVVVVPTSEDNSAVLGHLMTDAEISRTQVAGWRTDLMLDELGFPVVGA